MNSKTKTLFSHETPSIHVGHPSLRKSVVGYDRHRNHLIHHIVLRRCCQADVENHLRESEEDYVQQDLGIYVRQYTEISLELSTLTTIVYDDDPDCGSSRSVTIASHGRRLFSVGSPSLCWSASAMGTEASPSSADASLPRRSSAHAFT